MFVVDFDDTLFDTHRFKRTLITALSRAGVGEADATWSYQAAYADASGQFTHSNKRRAEFLGTRGHEVEKVLAALDSCVDPAVLGDHVLPGATDLLQWLKALGQPLVLLSLGDPEFQETKVRGAGLAEYFDRLFMVSDTKERVLGELLEHHRPAKYWLINDKVDESLALQKKFPELQIVLKQSERIRVEDYQNSGLPFYKDLVEIQKYVANNVTK